LHQMLYIVGRSRLRNDVVAAEIAYDKQSPMFLISTKEEKQHRSRENLIFTILSVIYFLAAVGLAFFAGVGMAQAPGFSQDVWHIVCSILVGIGVFLAPAALWGIFWLWTVYNSLIGIKNRVRQAWSNIDVELKRRFDLIESLVNVIKGFQKYECETQETLVILRSQIKKGTSDGSTPDLAACSPCLSILIENYPEIKSNELFRNLHDNLAETEQRIALARGYYNEMVSYYNDRRERVPECYVATMARLTPQPFFHAENFEKFAVTLKIPTGTFVDGPS